jgi:hypothetical protein
VFTADDFEGHGPRKHEMIARQIAHSTGVIHFAGRSAGPLSPELHQWVADNCPDIAGRITPLTPALATSMPALHWEPWFALY